MASVKSGLCISASLAGLSSRGAAARRAHVLCRFKLLQAAPAAPRGPNEHLAFRPPPWQSGAGSRRAQGYGKV